MSSTAMQHAPQGRGRGFTIGARHFRAKKDAIAEIRDILNYRYRPGECLIAGDHDLIEALFNMHPHCAEKARKGIDGFVVMNNMKDGFKLTRGFHVLHPDGTTTDWSFYVALGNKPAYPTFKAAARKAILDSQRDFKDATFGPFKQVMMCPYCNLPMKRQAAEVHHIPPLRFRDMLAMWVEEHGEPEVKEAQEGFGDDFADPVVRQAFLDWHDATANRIAICAACNMDAEANA